MRNVFLPDNSTSMNELDTALKYQSGVYKYELEQSEIIIINNFYKKYDTLLGKNNDDFKSILLKEDTNNALHIAYNEIQLSGRLNSLRSKLLLAADRCPYCGISPVDELDHYLPKSVYKALSVYSRNLIPICHTCNNAKRTAIETGTTNSFFHAYFEVFPDLPAFIAEVSFENDILIINYKVDRTHIINDLGDKLDFQFHRTKLNARLLKETNNYIFDNKSAIELMFEMDNVNGVKKLFLKQYVESKEKYGVNYWKTSLLLSLSNCQAFCTGGFKEYFIN